MIASITSMDELRAYAVSFVQTHADGTVAGLSGDLGAGKTTFVRTIVGILAERAGIKPPRVTSPSYVIHQRYDGLSMPVDHLDLYRMEKLTSQGLVELGYHDILERRNRMRGLVFVEWPENAARLADLQLECQLSLKLDGSLRSLEYKKIS